MAVTGCDVKSSSSVGGGNLFGRISDESAIGSIVSEPKNRSENTRMKYCGGSGSKSGTVNERISSFCFF